MSQPPPSLAAGLKDRYRLERELGAGGMATVYLAHDLKHDRPVALKVLRPELAAALGSERFLSEIQTTAKLQHPHILGLIDSGAVADQLFYVMPLVNGESLRARLQREKQLGVSDALRIAREVALALDYAHRQGVIHRDVKPENILLQDGQAVVADFGIALAIEHAGAGRLTATGLSMGTPQYMSPEQAMGERALTARSDVYALGCVLYEMLAGEPPFTGPTAQAIVARAMVSEPHEITTLRSSVPLHVSMAIATALRKVPADRFATAQAFADAISDDAAVSVVARAQARRSWQGVAAVLALVAVGGATGWIAQRNLGARPHGPMLSRLALLPPESTVFAYVFNSVALSPDGTTMAYASTPEGVPASRAVLAVRGLGDAASRLIKGSDGLTAPFFSPDGRQVAFYAGQTLKVASLSDGSVTALISSADSAKRVIGAGDGVWDRDGTILLGRFAGGAVSGVGITRVNVERRSVDVLTHLDTAAGEVAHYSPVRIPGAGRFLYIAQAVLASGASFRIMSQPLGGGPPELVLEGPRLVRYAGHGWLLYQRDGDVFADRIDERTLTLAHAETRVLEGVDVLGRGWSVADDVAVYRPGTPTDRALVWVSRNGSVEVLPVARTSYRDPRISPDGNRLSLTVGVSAADLVVYDLRRNLLTKVTTDGSAGGAQWSDDGARLFYSGAQSGSRAIYARNSDGTGTPERLIEGRVQHYPAGLADSSRTLVFMRLSSVDSIGGIWTMGVGGGARPIVQLLKNALGGRVSPNGRWIAYFVGSEMFVSPFPNATRRWQIASDNAREAVWSADGRELFFRHGNALMVTNVNEGASFGFDPPRRLFEGAFYTTGGAGNVQYDVSRDGKRFLMLLEPKAGVPRLEIVQGWKTIVARAVAAKQ